MTVRNIEKSLAGTEDLALGIGTAQQKRGTVHRINVFPSSYNYVDMQQYEGGDFFRLYGADTFYTDYRRNPVGTVGIPAGAGGVWEPIQSSDRAVGGNFTNGAYLVDAESVAWHAGTASYYSWTGTLPHEVAPGTDPTATPGYALCAGVALRDALAADSSQVLVAGVPAETIGFLMKTRVLVTERRFTGGVDITSGTVSAVSAIQAAIDYVSSNGGGIVECGISGAKYLLDAGIILKAKVWLHGVDFPVVDHNLPYAMPTLLVTYGKGSESLPAIRQNQGSYLSGFNVEYPDQVRSDMTDPHTGAVQAAPYPYGWFLTLNNQDYGTSNIDAAACGNMFIKNAYNGIKYFRCGKYNLHDIYGQPLRRGLWIDMVLDVSRQTNIHFWTYHAMPGSLLYKWIKSNGEAYLLGRADQVTSISLFAYGYYIGRYFIGLGGGGAWWGDFYGCLMDVCTKPLVIESVNKVNDYGCDNTTAEFKNPCLLTTSGNMTTPGIYAMHGGSLNGGSNIGALVSALDGTYIFNDVNFGNQDTSGNLCTPLVVEATATVKLNGGKYKSLPLLGGVNCSIDGVTMPSADNAVTLSADPNVATNWTGSPAQDGTAVTFSTTTSSTWDYVVPATAYSNFVGLIEFELLDDGVVDKFLWIRLCRNDGGEQSASILASVSGASGKGAWMTVRFPIFQGSPIDGQVLKVQVNSYSGKVASVSIKNLKFYASNTVSTATPGKVIDAFGSVPSRFVVKHIGYNSGFKELLVISAPSTLNSKLGDRAINVAPSKGAQKGWRFTGGAWVGEGVL